MKAREQENHVDIPLADYIRQHYKTQDLFIAPIHPTTEFFLYMIKEIHKHINVDLADLNDEKFNVRNYTELPFLSDWDALRKGVEF